MRLDRLWADVVDARAALARERREPRQRSEPSARIDLIHALEAYLGNVEACGYPAPYMLTNELNLHRLALPMFR